MIVFAERLKAIRKKNNLLQKQVANILQVKERMYRHYEAGDVDPPISKVVMLADFLCESIDYLTGRVIDKDTFYIQVRTILSDNRISFDTKLLYLQFCHLATNGIYKVSSKDIFCTDYTISTINYDNAIHELLTTGYIISQRKIEENNRAFTEYVLEDNPNKLKDILSRHKDMITQHPVAASCYSANMINNRIHHELDLIGISPSARGRLYIADAISLILNDSEQNIYTTISTKYGKSRASVERAMQNAINSAWYQSNSLLHNSYFARVSRATGTPKIIEFVYYFANKIKGSVQLRDLNSPTVNSIYQGGDKEREN